MRRRFSQVVAFPRPFQISLFELLSLSQNLSAGLKNIRPGVELLMKEKILSAYSEHLAGRRERVVWSPVSSTAESYRQQDSSSAVEGQEEGRAFR